MKDSGGKAFVYSLAALVAGFSATMISIYLFLTIFAGFGINWESIITLDTMGGWFIFVFIITLMLSGGVYYLLISRKAK
jgi:hypothetical protein